MPSTTSRQEERKTCLKEKNLTNSVYFSLTQISRMNVNIKTEINFGDKKDFKKTSCKDSVSFFSNTTDSRMLEENFFLSSVSYYHLASVTLHSSSFPIFYFLFPLSSDNKWKKVINFSMQLFFCFTAFVYSCFFTSNIPNKIVIFEELTRRRSEEREVKYSK